MLRFPIFNNKEFYIFGQGVPSCPTCTGRTPVCGWIRGSGIPEPANFSRKCEILHTKIGQICVFTGIFGGMGIASDPLQAVLALCSTTAEKSAWRGVKDDNLVSRISRIKETPGNTLAAGSLRRSIIRNSGERSNRAVFNRRQGTGGIAGTS